MRVPSKIVPFEKWTAYKGPFPEDSSMPHIIIIVHKTKDDIYYFYVTSKVSKAERISKDDRLSLVKLLKDDWSKLTKESCIQCNKGHRRLLN
jgi:hypothetical protein